MNGEAVGLASGSDWKQRRQPDGMLLVQGLQLLTLGTTPCPPRLLPPSTTLQRVHRRSVSVNRTNNVLWLQRPSSVYSRLSRLSLLNNQRRDEIHWPLLVSINSGGYGVMWAYMILIKEMNFWSKISLKERSLNTEECSFVVHFSQKPLCCFAIIIVTTDKKPSCR